jgi:hypothetical protein
VITQTSGGSGSERYQEARRILFTMDLVKKVSVMTPKNRTFIEGLVERIEKYGINTTISPKVLFWLRDLKDTYIV